MSKLIFEQPIIKPIRSGVPSKFGMQPQRKPIENIDGVAVNELVDKYGSLLYVLKEKTLRENYQKAYRAF